MEIINDSEQVWSYSDHCGPVFDHWFICFKLTSEFKPGDLVVILDNKFEVVHNTLDQAHLFLTVCFRHFLKHIEDGQTDGCMTTYSTKSAGELK